MIKHRGKINTRKRSEPEGPAIPGNVEVRVALDDSAGGRQLALHELQQGRFSSAVGPDEHL
jgi:hypothetical protein